MQKKINKSWFIKLTSKPRKKKKSSTKFLDLCFYYTKSGYFIDKYYYKYLKHFNENFDLKLMLLRFILIISLIKKITNFFLQKIKNMLHKMKI